MEKPEKSFHSKRFVVQEHHAGRLHWDFRLEMDGVLKSWAVPKGIPEAPLTKHLAIQVEDHSVDYADFEGIIPPGEYGAGLVKIWDKGNYKLIKLFPEEIEIILEGQRLNGHYVLLKTGWQGKKNNWLIFKTSEQ